MKQWWGQLSDRDKKLVIVMTALLVPFIVYQMIWLPISDGLAKEQKKLTRNQELYAYVQSNIAHIKNAGISGNKVNKGGSLSSQVNRSAQSHGIKIDRVQPQGDDLSVWIDQVPFNSLLSFITDLSKNNGLQVKNIDIVETDASGVVKVRRLQLGRS